MGVWMAEKHGEEQVKIIGIDPGVTGALGVITDVSCDVMDTPVFEKMKAKERTTYNVREMYDALWAEQPQLIVIEQLQPMGRNGSIANYQSGLGFAYWHMAAVALDVPIILVNPKKWKKAMGLTANKDDSRQRAIELFPALATSLKLKKHHGRAEAILLAEYGRRVHKI